MTIQGTIDAIDIADAEAARLLALNDAAEAAAGNAADEAEYNRRTVACDAIRDALRRARDGAEVST